MTSFEQFKEAFSLDSETVDIELDLSNENFNFIEKETFRLDTDFDTLINYIIYSYIEDQRC